MTDLRGCLCCLADRIDDRLVPGLVSNMSSRRTDCVDEGFS